MSIRILTLLIGKTIGKGTFGKVKLGSHNLTGEKVLFQFYETIYR